MSVLRNVIERLGLREGWRVSIFLALLVVIVLGCIRLLHALGVHQPAGIILPSISLVGSTERKLHD